MKAKELTPLLQQWFFQLNFKHWTELVLSLVFASGKFSGKKKKSINSRKEVRHTFINVFTRLGLQKIYKWILKSWHIYKSKRFISVSSAFFMLLFLPPEYIIFVIWLNKLRLWNQICLLSVCLWAILVARCSNYVQNIISSCA